MRKRGVYPRNPTFEALASRPRREILHALSTSESSFTERRLAAALAARTGGSVSPCATNTEAMRTKLAHVHLPKLADAGLVDWERDGDRVEPAAHPAFDDPRCQRLVETQVDDLNEVLGALSHEYRRIALTVLEEDQSPLSRSELEGEIRRRERAATEFDPAVDEDVSVSLHHVHLPRLDDLGFIEYDPEMAQAAYVGDPALERVFTIIYQRDESTADKLDGFLTGLADSYRETSSETHVDLDWPHFWRDPHHG